VLVHVTRLNAAFRLEFLDQHVKPAHSRRLARCPERPWTGVVRQRGCASPPWRQDAPRPRLVAVASERVYRPLEEAGPARAFRSKRPPRRAASLRLVQTPRTPKITADVSDSKAPECAQTTLSPARRSPMCTIYHM